MHDYIESKKKPQTDTYIFSGHVHPIVWLKGKGRQSFCLPCFYFSDQYAVLPAFSRFTGGYKVDVKKGDSVFAITGKEIMALTN
jgi:metallophosphoesterase superfamily enzyme